MSSESVHADRDGVSYEVTGFATSFHEWLLIGVRGRYDI